MLTRTFAAVAIIAGVGAAVLFLIHTFLYLAVAMVAVVFATAAGATSAMLRADPSGRTHMTVTASDVLRLAIVLIALLTLSVTAVSSEGPGGQQAMPSAISIDLVAAAAILVVGVWWWSDGRSRRTS